MNAKEEGIIFGLKEIAKVENETSKACINAGDIGLGIYAMTAAKLITEAVSIIEQQAREIKALKSGNASEAALTLNDCVNHLVHTAHSTYPDAVLKIIKKNTCIVAPVAPGLLVELPKEQVFITK
ncbi:hypothetical protein IGG09_000698 [Escherichia coli]|uniref:hypothetical protein n=2 Tax=Escherichia coli TaxID=562 RepID=UPI000BE4C942|nr:hypothetical protein [Escherichia coli]EHL6318797.1 hypothetical protein [Escherichia coli]EIH6279667.1 hypothetical protein [Escherichia coli]EII4820145.1 hypothetical protein [Escherichia coli]ELV1750257.1 hypothetical protein [Escherichia coli]HAM7739318.1 hypothetical protein [Escherichia coli]